MGLLSPGRLEAGRITIALIIHSLDRRGFSIALIVHSLDRYPLRCWLVVSKTLYAPLFTLNGIRFKVIV